MASVHLQFLIGIVLYLQSPWFQALSEQGMSVMSNGAIRFYAIEHPTMMLLSVVFATIGNAKAKRAANDAKAFQARVLWFSIALVLILVAIPWPFRFGNAGWF